MSKIKDWFHLLRLRYHYLITIICAVGLANRFSLVSFLFTIALVYSSACYAELVNFIYDFKIDSKNPSMKKYAHIQGKISLYQLKLASYFFFILILISGISLFFIKNNFIFIFLTLWAIHCGYSYSVPPLRLKRFWWGGIVTYTFSSTVSFLIGAFAFGATSIPIIFLTSLVFWFGSLSAWALMHIPDIKFDKKENIVSPAIKFGKTICIKYYKILFFFSSFFGAFTVLMFFKNYFAIIPFIVSVLLSFHISRLMNGIFKTQKMRHKIYKLSVLPYRLNIIFLTIFYFLV